MSVPSGVILIWPGSNASIPAGWQRETGLDSKFLKGWGDENPNTSGGASTHTHTGSHGHTLTHHAHTFSSGTGNENGVQTCSNADEGNISAHTHSTHTINSTSGGSLQSTAVTWQSASNEPPYQKVIFIKPSTNYATIASGMLSYFYGATVPTKWYYCDGNNSTVDLRGKYLKGASTGADSDMVSTLGSLNHSHVLDHTHTVSPHTHSGYMTGIGSWSGGRGYSSNPTGSFCHKNHQHIVDLAATTDTINGYTGSSGSADTVEPAYKKLGILKNVGGILTKGIIGMWLGNVDDIPAGWKLCDGSNGTLDLRNKFIKIGTSLAQNGDTGGSNTHTHGNVSHTHTPTGTHSHTGSHGVADMRSNPGGANDGVCYYTHVHSINSVSSQSAAYSSDNITADTVDNQPPYKTVAFIQFMYHPFGGAAVLGSVLTA